MPTLGVSTQNLRNSALRDKYKLPKGKTGVLVVSLQLGAQQAQCIQKGDILLRIADHDIANNGTVLYKGRYRTIYWVALTEYYVGESVEIGIWRDGKELSVEVELLEWRNLVKRNCYDTRPRFFVYGGLVFQPLTRGFIETWGKWNNAPKEFLYLYYFGKQTSEQTEVIILSQVLADNINVGYSNCYNEVVTHVNGIRPRDMKQFVSLILESDSEVEICLSSASMIVFNPSEVEEAKIRIMQRYHVPKNCSHDLEYP